LTQKVEQEDTEYTCR